MEKKLCYYTIVKFVPNTLRNEQKNIGVIIFDESAHKSHSYFPETIVKHKIGASTWSQNKKVVEHYQAHLPETKEELLSWTNVKDGLIQFSDVKSLVTLDIEVELRYLSKVFVDEAVEERVVHHRFKNSLIKDLRTEQIIGQNKFVQDTKIKSKKTSVEFNLDLSYQNSILYAVETVDLTKQDKMDTFETAYKFEDLKKEWDKKIHTISVIKMPIGGDSISDYYSILKSASDEIFDISQDQVKLVAKLKSVIH